MDHRVHRLATIPLNYLGYAVEYADIDEPLPAHPLTGRYADIVSWFASEDVGGKASLRERLARQREQA